MRGEGIWTALVTPFSQDGSQIDWGSFEKLIQHQNGSVEGVVICGTTGEAPTLSVHEKLALIRKARVLLKKEIRLMAGTGGSSTDQTIELSKLALDAGADSLLIVTPPYNKPSPAGLALHFEALSKSLPANVDLCLYHVPGRTAQFLSIETIKLITDIPGVRMLKEASADMSFFSRARQMCRKECSFLSGDDLTFLPSLSLGGEGIISVVTNVFPQEFKLLQKFFSAGEMGKALSMHQALASFIDLLFVETNPGPVKAALSLLGLCQNTLRLPLAPVTATSFAKIEHSLKETQKTLRALAL